jgi:hypothetical protein
VTDSVFLPLAHGLDWTTPLSPDQQQLDRTHIKAVVKDKEWLVGFYDRAIRRITRGPRDKKTQNSLRFLVAALLYKLADKHLSVSESKPITKVILQVCEFADPEIKPSTVKTFIKDIVHADKAWETEPVEGVWVITTKDPNEPPIHLVPPVFPPPRSDW